MKISSGCIVLFVLAARMRRHGVRGFNSMDSDPYGHTGPGGTNLPNVKDNDQLPSCATSKSRRLQPASSAAVADGHVLHLSSSHQIARDEVVASFQLALKGGDSFEVVLHTDVTAATEMGNEIVVLTKDHMQFSHSALVGVDRAITDRSFEIQNAFVKSGDDSIYTVHCPAESSKDMCNVTRVNASDGPPPFGRCLVKDDYAIDDACLDEEYTVSLLAFRSPHFVLGAFSPHENCPNVAFDSVNGDKRRVQFSSKDANIVAFHHVGKASLRALLESEKQVDGLDLASITYDMTTNSCVHYAGNIWRRVNITESVELAEFVIENIVGDPNIEILAADFWRARRLGAVRYYLAARAIGGSKLFREKLEELVYSQFIM